MSKQMNSKVMKPSSTYPLKIFHNRNLPPRYHGSVFVWDVDKTYLSTRFSSMGGLLKIPVEFAIDKAAIPGMPAILRGLRRGSQKKYESHPLYFISASPPFLRNVLERKMLLDGVEQDGIIFKDWIKTCLQLRPMRLFEQVGFKVTALILGRLSRPHAAEYLFGDDVEKDPEAFSLYANFINGNIKLTNFIAQLKSLGVPLADRKNIKNLAEQISMKTGSVKKIFIHLEGNSDPEYFKKFGHQIMPVRGSLQLALALYPMKLIDVLTVQQIKQTLEKMPNYRFGDCKKMVQDALDRGLITKRQWTSLAQEIR